MSPGDLLAAARDLVERSRGSEADLLVLLGEIDERKLYLDQACASMFAFCVREYGFSEDVACNRISGARTARRLPAVLDALRSGKLHLAGLRVLGRHLTAANHSALLDAAAGKTRGEIEEIVAGIAASTGLSAELETSTLDAPSSGLVFAAGRSGAAYVVPIAADRFRFHFTASRGCRDKFREAQDLLRHRVRNGDAGTIVEMALEALIAQVKKERFATGRKAKNGSPPRDGQPGTARSRKGQSSRHLPPASRHIPAAVKREVFARDGGRCAFTDARGRRCSATAALEFDHIDGFARTRRHDANRIRLVCRAHNQHAADKMYGHDFMEKARTARQLGSKMATGPP